MAHQRLSSGFPSTTGLFTRFANSRLENLGLEPGKAGVWGGGAPQWDKILTPPSKAVIFLK